MPNDKEELKNIQVQLQNTQEKLEQVIKINKEIKLTTASDSVVKELATEITKSLEEKATEISDALATKVADKVVIEITKKS